ncbi:MAG: glycerol-3-phosphate dehydrogenase/oxidase [Polyangiales bacterium]
MPTRSEMWNRLGAEELDVLVVGGGVTGAGIARDASEFGLRTALVEMNDLAYGTSSRSTKLVHGGLRYLETGEVGLVFESVSERRVLMSMAPHLVKPLGFLVPVFHGAKRPLALVSTGMWIYDALSLFRSPKIHKTLKADALAAEEPCLRTDGVEGAPLYYDCSTDDARLTLEAAIAATRAGAIVATWTKVESFVRDPSGCIVGVNVRCMLTGQTKEVRARAVVNATGPWTDATLRMAGATGSHVLRPTKGIHIVVDAAKLPLRHAVLLMHPKDARVMFAIPWGDRTYIGTTDTDFQGDPADVAATLDDVDYVLASCAEYFPRNPLTRDDVIATWAGLRPLLAPPEKGDDMAESQVSREHHVFVRDDGLVTIAGGKLTTFRLMAMDVIDVVRERLGAEFPKRRERRKRSRKLLPGAFGYGDTAEVAQRVRTLSGNALDPDVAEHLASTYGGLAVHLAALVAQDPSLGEPLVAGRPEILAQVDWAVQQELAATVSDVMVRRTQLFFRDRDQGLGAAAEVADRMGKLLGWDAAARDASIAQYEDEVARSRRWRNEARA